MIDGGCYAAQQARRIACEIKQKVIVYVMRNDNLLPSADNIVK